MSLEDNGAGKKTSQLNMGIITSHRFRISAFFLFLFVCLLPRPAAAQTYSTFQSELNNIVERTRLRLGPFRFVPRIDFRFLRYEWNIFFQRDDENPSSDMTSSISPELNAYVIIKDRVILRISDRLSYVHYFRFKEERRLNNRFSPEIKWMLFNRFVLVGAYENSRDRGRPTSEFNIRANEYRETFRGQLFFETPKKTSIGLTFAQNKYVYDDISFPGQEVELSRLLNRTNQQFQIEFNYPVLSDSWFFITADFTDHSFDNIEEFNRNSYSLQAQTGLRFPLIGGITGTLALGIKQIKPRAEEFEGKKGLIGNTALNFRGGRLGARVSYTRDFPFSLWDNNVFFINNRYLLGASVYPVRSLRLDYDFSLGSSHYPELIPFSRPDGSIEEINRVDTYRIHTLRLVIRLFKEIGLGISANQWARNSNYYGESRSQIYLDASLIVDF